MKSTRITSLPLKILAFTLLAFAGGCSTFQYGHVEYVELSEITPATLRALSESPQDSCHFRMSLVRSGTGLLDSAYKASQKIHIGSVGLRNFSFYFHNMPVGGLPRARCANLTGEPVYAEGGQ